jgi:hypothetical protein
MDFWIRLTKLCEKWNITGIRKDGPWWQIQSEFLAELESDFRPDEPIENLGWIPLKYCKLDFKNEFRDLVEMS